MRALHAVTRLLARAGFFLIMMSAAVALPWAALVAEAQNFDTEVDAALRRLYQTTPEARELGATAKGIAVFPYIFTENYMFGIQSGYGALIVGGRIVGYYVTDSVTYGLQAGILPFGYVLFLMTDAAVTRLEEPGGWDVGKDPRVSIVRRGAKPDSTDTQSGTLDATSGTMAQRPPARIDTYAFVLGETDLMTGVGIQGWRIVKLSP